MREKLAKLINVKSILTILLSIVFCYLSIINQISNEQFMNIFTVIIAFYFGTQAQKNAQE